MQAHMKGCVFLLILNEHVEEVLKQAMSFSRDDEGLSTVKVTRKVWRVKLVTIKRFTGTFNVGFPNESVPQSLRHLTLYLRTNKLKLYPFNDELHN